MQSETYYSNGKLLLTGEYVVLDGALSLAVPTKFGQSLNVDHIAGPKLIWESIDQKGNTWFRDAFNIDEIASDSTKPLDDISGRLQQTLTSAKQLNPKFLSEKTGFKITTHLGFPKDWGLGTSSTLITNIANWAKVDAYKLLEITFGGSGYDIACAQHDSAITYQLQNESRLVTEVEFLPIFKDQLYFVYLNKKQNSRDAINHYKSHISNHSEAIAEINEITLKFMDCSSLEDFEYLITQHEHIISSIIKQKPIKTMRFSDFKGSIKSLGAWGGDFIMATSMDNPMHYFKSKGYNTIIPYKDMIL